jgi:hypothetical protein
LHAQLLIPIIFTNCSGRTGEVTQWPDVPNGNPIFHSNLPTGVLRIENACGVLFRHSDNHEIVLSIGGFGLGAETREIYSYDVTTNPGTWETSVKYSLGTFGRNGLITLGPQKALHFHAGYVKWQTWNAQTDHFAGSIYTKHPENANVSNDMAIKTSRKSDINYIPTENT